MQKKAILVYPDKWVRVLVDGQLPRVYLPTQASVKRFESLTKYSDIYTIERFVSNRDAELRITREN